MNKDTSFSYNYSAKINKEVADIRAKYLPQEESRLDRLKRLDYTVQTAGIPESLCFGIGGALIFGLGLCLAMQVIGNTLIFVVLGIILGVIGIAAMIAAYPVYRMVFNEKKKKLTPEILKLTDELSA